MDGIDMTKFTDADLTAEGYFVVCDDLHGVIGPYSIARALAGAITMNEGPGRCKYRVVTRPGTVSMEAARELRRIAELTA